MRDIRLFGNAAKTTSFTVESSDLEMRMSLCLGVRSMGMTEQVTALQAGTSITYRQKKV